MPQRKWRYAILFVITSLVLFEVNSFHNEFLSGPYQTLRLTHARITVSPKNTIQMSSSENIIKDDKPKPYLSRLQNSLRNVARTALNSVWVWWQMVTAKHSISVWWQMMWRKYMASYSVYVLECEQGKYYVGSTKRMMRDRYAEHQAARGGSKWTKEYKPIRIVELSRRIPQQFYAGFEAAKTAEYMLKFGVNNVRGAYLADPRMFDSGDLEMLTGFIGHFNHLNYKVLSDQLAKTLPPAIKPKSKKRSVKGKSQHGGGRCFKCGEEGHAFINCPEI